MVLVAFVMMFAAVPWRGADRARVGAEDPPRAVIDAAVEEVPAAEEKPVKTALNVDSGEQTFTVIEAEDDADVDGAETYTGEETAVNVYDEEPSETEALTEVTMPAETEPIEETEETEAYIESETEVAEESVNVEPKEETVECIDEGDQSLAEYKPQIDGQANPFENDIPTEIDDRPVEDYVGEGEDRPGEGIHF